MYIIKNALANLKRNAGRNILLGAIIFSIVFAVAVALVIHASTTVIIQNYKEQFGANVTIVRNDAKLTQEALQNYHEATAAQLLEFSKSELLKESSLRAVTSVKLKDLKGINEGNENLNGGVQTDTTPSPSANTQYVSPNATIFAISQKTISAEFENGQRRVMEGSYTGNENEVIISQKLATLNNLHIGDRFTAESTGIATLNGAERVEQEFLITGIYEDLTPADPNDIGLASTNRGNEIFTGYASINGALFQSDAAFVEGSFVMKNPDDLEKLNQEFHAAGAPEYFDLSADEAAYQRIVGPVEGLKEVTKTFAVGILIFGGVLLLILSALAVRERKYEVGVLRAIGMKKRNIMLGFVSEMLAVTGICLLLGLGSAAVVSQPVADTLMEQQVASSAEETTGMLGGEMNSAQMITSVDASLSAASIWQIVGVSLLLAALASIAGLLFIIRYEPMKILSERN